VIATTQKRSGVEISRWGGEEAVGEVE